MTWQAEADKHVNTPVVLVSVAFNSGTRYYSTTYVRTATRCYTGKITSLPEMTSSVGSIRRTYERNKITIVFDDSDYEFRGLETTETVSFKNRTVIISSAFADDDYANAEVLFTGQVYDWRLGNNLQFELEIEEKSYNMENEYPNQRAELTDYANADGAAIGWTIPIPYGTISAYGESDDGGFGHPSLVNFGFGGMLLIDNRVDQEKHLVGYQDGAITVSRVYLDGALQTEGAGNDYQISTQVIDGFTRTEIHWEAGANPTVNNRVSCDIVFGSRGPVEAIKHFLKTFCGYEDGDFNAAAYATALTIETSRGYTFDGALWETRALKTILDEWRDEYELDIFWNPSGEIVFNYLSAIITTANEYNALCDILGDNFDSDPQVVELVNKIKYGYSFHYSKDYYHAYATYEDTASQTKYDMTVEKFQGFRWIRNASVARDIASRKIVRLKDPVTFDEYPFPLKTFSESLANAVKITHLEGRGPSGYIDKLFQVRSVSLDINTMQNRMLLEDASNFTGNACILGNGLVIADTWTSATDADRDYCYMCDSVTGLFSDGLDGKRMFD